MKTIQTKLLLKEQKIPYDITNEGLSNENLDLLKEKFEDIRDMGYVHSHRKGPRAVGNTLEDLLGIKENCNPSTDILQTELKTARKPAKSMLTLVTKTPQPEGAAMDILKKYGYISKKSGKKTLHSTLTAGEYNTLKKNPFCKVIPTTVDDEFTIGIEHQSDGIIGYWKDSLLRETFQDKYPFGRLFYVKADCKGSTNTNESFWYNEAYLYNGFKYDIFINMLKQGVIKCDLRIGLRSNGSTHDHGTGFRVRVSDLDKLFDSKTVLL